MYKMLTVYHGRTYCCAYQIYNDNWLLPDQQVNNHTTEHYTYEEHGVPPSRDTSGKSFLSTIATWLNLQSYKEYFINKSNK